MFHIDAVLSVLSFYSLKDSDKKIISRIIYNVDINHKCFLSSKSSY